MVEQKEYTNIDTICLSEGCNVTLKPKRDHLRPWRNWQRRVELEPQTQGYSVETENNRLILENYRGTLYLPARRSMNIIDQSGDNTIGGKLYTGRIQSNNVDLDIPFSYERVRGAERIMRLAQDVGAISLTSLLGIAALNLVGLDPVDYWDSIGIGAAAVWAAVRGDRQAMLNSSLVAAALVFGPEFVEHGFREGLNKLGGEDLLKTCLYLISLPIGTGVRRYVKGLLE